MIRICEQSSRFTSDDGVVFASLDNRVVWRPGTNERTIIAMGGPGDWHSTRPLPADAVQTDLVAASLEQPGLANEFWGCFIGYIVANAKLSVANSLKYAFLARYLGVDVRIAIADTRTRAAVRNALHGSPAKFRLNVTEAG